MAEFIAEDPVHVVVSSERPAIYDHQGRMVQPKVRKVWAKFVRGAAPKYAQDVALDTFSFRKIHQGIERERWFGYYNSREAQQQNGWTDEEHDFILARLRELGYLEVQPVKLAAPVPAYDKIKVHGRATIQHVVEKITGLVESTGLPAEDFLAYERQELNRPEVVAALEALIDSDSEPEPEPELLAA